MIADSDARQLRSGWRGVEFGLQSDDAPSDLVAGGADIVDWPAVGVLDFPTDVALAGNERALIVAAHGHGHVRSFGDLGVEQSRLVVGEVIAHNSDYLGMTSVGPRRADRGGAVPPVSGLLEQRLSHMRAPGVSTDEQHVLHACVELID